VPEGVESYLYSAHWACRVARKLNRRQARKGKFCSEVCGTRAFLGVSRQNIRRKIKRWMDSQHLVMWKDPCSTQRQARELISGPD